MKKYNLTIFLVLINLFLFIGYMFYQEATKPKVAYLELQKVFNEFSMTKEMSADIDKIQKTQDAQLDTIALRIELFKRIYGASNSPAIIDSVKQKEYEYYIKKQSFDDNLNKLTSNHNEKIWKQLNQYISEFGRDNNYDYLHGASGNGSIMYADSSNNITKELIIYVNNKYDGK